MPKYTKSVRKNNMRKNKRGRSRRGGYWFYPGPGDDEHAFTKLKNKLSSGDWKFWQKQPEFVPPAHVSSDYQPAAEEQSQGSLEYPQPPMESPETNLPMDNQEEEAAPMVPSPPMDNQEEEAPMEPSPPMDNQEEEAPMVESNPKTPPALIGGRRRRQKRSTKKRKRANMRRRTNKRRRSNKRR